MVIGFLPMITARRPGHDRAVAGWVPGRDPPAGCPPADVMPGARSNGVSMTNGTRWNAFTGEQDNE
jgi:hypothetical protein